MTGFRHQPPPSDADLDVWAAWLQAEGRSHLDPERMRAEIRKQRGNPIFGVPAYDPALDVPEQEPEMPTLDLNIGPLSRREEVELGTLLEDTAIRAGSRSGPPGMQHHPIIHAIKLLAREAPKGQASVRFRLGREDRELLDRVLGIAMNRAFAEGSPAAEPMRRLSDAVEKWVYGPKGRPVVPMLQNERAWPSSDGPFRPLR